MTKEKSFSFRFSSDKKGVDSRLQGSQSALLLQEETIRRAERERKTMLDQIAGLERQITAMDNDKKQVLVRFDDLKKNLFFIFSSRAKWTSRKRANHG